MQLHERVSLTGKNSCDTPTVRAKLGLSMLRIGHLSFLIGLCFVPPAWAHHPTSSFGLSAAAPQSMVELESQWAQYPKQLDNRGGQYTRVSLRLEYAFTERFSAAASLPFAGVSPSGTDTTYGIGDAELSAKWSILRPKKGFGHLSIGSGIEMPTGDDEEGIGAGHFELTPFISYQSPAIRGHFVAFGRIALLAALGDHHHHEQHSHTDGHTHHHQAGLGAVLAPHTELELQTMVGAAWLEKVVYGSLSFDYAQPLDDHADRTALLVASAEVGLLAIESWRFALAWDQPLTEAKRIEGRARLGIGYWFD